MEVVVEVVLQVLAWLFELSGEFLVQVLAELFAESSSHLASRKRAEADDGAHEPVEPWVAMIGYALFGAAMGLASLWLLPHSFITSTPLRVANLLFTPVCSGLAMALLGSWRARCNQRLIRLNKFTYGFCFAFAMSLVRFYLAH